MREDAELLRRYVEQRSEEDFAELVGRHSGLVYYAALRRVHGRVDIAKDITQDVFANLARQARSLLAHPVLSGWLYTTTRFVANRHLRDEHRRSEREREAFMRNEFPEEKSSVEWEQVYRELDGAMDSLGVRDREAILLRYFHGEAFAQIGEHVGLSEDAARKRVDRALDRLRNGLMKRGVVSSAAALGSALSVHAAQAVPFSIGQLLTSAALAQAATAKLPVAALLHFMSVKLGAQLTTAAIIAALLIVSGTGVIVHEVRAVGKSSERLHIAHENHHTDVARLNELKKQAVDAEVRLARLQSEADQAQTTLAEDSRGAGQTANGQGIERAHKGGETESAFLMAFPEARPILLELGRAQIRASMGGFYEMVRLTPAQMERFETRTTEYFLEHLATSKNSIEPTVSDLPETEARVILGEEAYQKYEEFKRLRPAYDAAGRVALAIGYLAPPLSPKQSAQLAQVISANDASGSANLEINQVDWDAVATRFETLLIPAQLKAAQPVLLELQLQQRVSRARENARSVSSSKP